MDLPPWLQTILTVLGILAVILPPLGRLLAKTWPDFGARVEALGVDLGVGLGKTPPAGMPRGVAPAAPMSERAENAATVMRAEVKKAAREQVPPLPLLCLTIAIALVAGCTRAEQIQAANAQRTAGHATAKTLNELCNYKAADAMPAPEARAYTLELDQRGCEVAWQAQTAFALAHRAQVHAIEAAQKGECLTTTPRHAPACDLLGMAAKTYEAGVDLANAVAAARGAAEAGTR